MPNLPGFAVNPRHYVFNWYEHFSRVELHIKPDESQGPLIETAVNGEITIYVETVRVAAIAA